MATRPVFFVSKDRPYYQEEQVSFQFNPGFSVVQKQKNICSIHEAFISRHHNARVLEISSKSNEPLGTQLSAFNLKINIGGEPLSLESVFQSSKVFQNGGPYIDLLYQPALVAKKDHRLHESGPLVQFVLNGAAFPLEPKTFFYDWLYVNAVAKDSRLAESICQYDAFTDIEFNPRKSINCQARSAAIFVSLSKLGLLDRATIDPASFKSIVYGISSPNLDAQQLSLFGE